MSETLQQFLPAAGLAQKKKKKKLDFLDLVSHLVFSSPCLLGNVPQPWWEMAVTSSPLKTGQSDFSKILLSHLPKHFTDTAV